MIYPERTFYLHSGRVILSKTEDKYPIESTEMRDISVDGKEHSEVRKSLDPHVIWKHSVPIYDKWLLTVSTQKGCVHNCKFCDVADLPFKGNLSISEIMDQIKMLVATTPELFTNGTKKAKLGFARMGEPAHNLDNVLNIIKYLKRDLQKLPQQEYLDIENKLHPKSYPNGSCGRPDKLYDTKYHDIFENACSWINWLPCFNSIIPRKTLQGLSGEEVIYKVLETKEKYCDGFLHFQISSNSTDEEKRKELFGGADVLTLEEVINTVNKYPSIKKRTVTLNFIVMKDVPIDVKYLMKLGLNPERFAVKLIPLNDTVNSKQNGLETQYNYNTYNELKKYAAQFKDANIPVVYDAIAKCEESGLCCGQLAHIFA